MEAMGRMLAAKRYAEAADSKFQALERAFEVARIEATEEELSAIQASMVTAAQQAEQAWLHLYYSHVRKEQHHGRSH